MRDPMTVTRYDEIGLPNSAKRRYELAFTQAVPPSITRLVAADPDRRVQDYVRSSPFMPPDMLADKALRSSCFATSKTWRRRPALFPTIFRLIQSAGHHRVSDGFSVWPEISTEVFPKSWESYRDRDLALDPTLAGDVIEKLAASDDGGVRSNLAGNPAISRDLRRQFASDKSADVRLAVANCLHTPADSLGDLLLDSDDHVRRAAFDNPNLPREVGCAAVACEASRLLKAWETRANEDDGCEVDDGLFCLLTRKKHLPLDIVLTCCDLHEFPLVVYSAHRLLTEDDEVWRAEDIERLTTHPGRRHLARHRNTPASLIATLAAACPDPQDQTLIAAHPAVAPATLASLAASPHAEVRCGAAGNAMAPPSLLAHLANDPEEGVQCAVASNPATPASILRQMLVTGLVKAQVMIARRPGCPRDILINLARHPDSAIQKAVVARSDPYFGCPPLEDPEVLVILSESPFAFARQCAVSHRKLPRSAVLRLLDDPEVASTIAHHPLAPYPYVAFASDTGAELFHVYGKDAVTPVLVSHGEESVRRLLATNASTPPAMLDWLSRDASKAIRKRVAEHHGTMAATLARLAFDPVGGVRRRARGNASCPPAIPDYVPPDGGTWETTWQAQDDLAVDRALRLWLPSATGDEVAAHADDPSLEVREAVGRHPLTPATLLADLANSTETRLRAAVAANPHTPPSVLRTLASSREWYVRWELARNRSTPPDALEILAVGGDGMILRALLNNPAIDLYNTVIGDDGGLAHRDQRGDDEASQYSAEKALRPVGAHIFSVIAQSGDHALLRELCRREAVPPPILIALAHSTDITLRETIAKNLDAPAAALMLLAKDMHARVRTAIAGNPATPLATQLALVGEINRDIQLALGGNRSTAPEVLARLSHVAVDWIVRCRVAAHPETPLDILYMLARDEESVVRQNLAARAGLTDDLRGILMADSDDYVRATALKNDGSGVRKRLIGCPDWDTDDPFADDEDDD